MSIPDPVRTADSTAPSGQVNHVMQVLLNRRSVRAYEEREISEDVKNRILRVALRAPTAGNMMLYSIIEVKDQSLKDRLVTTCDNQPFIARAPLVLLFLADYQRWWDYFMLSGVNDVAVRTGEPLRTPEEGDLMIACCDALIAAHTAVIAAESLGIGSCYIGDIMENYEAHREMFDLPRYALPICLVCFGYPTQQQRERPLTPRFDREFIVFENRYKRLGAEDLAEMYKEREARFAAGRDHGVHGTCGGAPAGAPAGAPGGTHTGGRAGSDAAAGPAAGPANVGQLTYMRKFNTDFAKEMTRSVRAMLATWTGGQHE